MSNPISLHSFAHKFKAAHTLTGQWLSKCLCACVHAQTCCGMVVDISQGPPAHGYASITPHNTATSIACAAAAFSASCHSIHKVKGRWSHGILCRHVQCPDAGSPLPADYDEIAELCRAISPGLDACVSATTRTGTPEHLSSVLCKEAADCRDRAQIKYSVYRKVKLHRLTSLPAGACCSS